MFWHSRWCAGTWGGRARPVMGRGKTRSRRRRSRSSECRGSWGNTALLGRTGPDTPADTERGKGGLGEIAYTQNKGKERFEDVRGRRSRTNTRTQISCWNPVDGIRDFQEHWESSGVEEYHLYYGIYPNPGRTYEMKQKKCNLKLDTVWKYLQE